MKQKFWQLLPAILFFLLFAVLLVLLLFGPRETRSLTEGRALAGRPVMDLHDPAALTQAFTDYAADADTAGSFRPRFQQSGLRRI